MNHVPNASSAFISQTKLGSYLLDVAHPEGGPKARFFLGKGFSSADCATFEAALREHVAVRRIWSIAPNPYGQKFVVSCDITTPDGSNPCIRSVWIIEDGETVPKLVTAYPA